MTKSKEKAKRKAQGKQSPRESEINWLHGQAVKTSPFHGGNTGSIPVGVTLKNEFGAIAKW